MAGVRTGRYTQVFTSRGHDLTAPETPGDGRPGEDLQKQCPPRASRPKRSARPVGSVAKASRAEGRAARARVAEDEAATADEEVARTARGLEEGNDRARRWGKRNRVSPGRGEGQRADGLGAQEPAHRQRTGRGGDEVGARSGETAGGGRDGEAGSRQRVTARTGSGARTRSSKATSWRAGRSAARVGARVPVAWHPRVRTHSVLPLGSGRGMCRRGPGGRPTPIETMVPWHVRVMVSDHTGVMVYVSCELGCHASAVPAVTDHVSDQHLHLWSPSQMNALDVLTCLIKVDPFLGGILTFPILPLDVRVALPKDPIREILVEGVTEGSAMVRDHLYLKSYEWACFARAPVTRTLNARG